MGNSTSLHDVSRQASENELAKLEQLDNLNELAQLLRSMDKKNKVNSKAWQVAFWGISGAGKTTLIEGLTLGTLPPRLKGLVKALAKLEAFIKLSSLRDDAEQLIPQVFQRPERYSTPTPDMEERYEEAQAILDRVRTYKLDPTPTDSAFGLIFPAGNSGSVGSTAPVIISGASSEFQVLVLMESRDAILDLLRQHLAAVDGSNDPGPTVSVHLARVWQLLTPPGTDLALELERSKTDPEVYEPPLRKEWEALLGNAYLARSQVSSPMTMDTASGEGCAAAASGEEWRAQDSDDEEQERDNDEEEQERDMLPELLFAGDVVRLFLPPGNEAAWDFNEDQIQLLKDFQEQDRQGTGPWSLLLEASEASPERLREVRETFQLCLQRLQLFVPSELLNTLNLEIVDPIGFDDANPRRRVVQRQLEETLDNVILLVDKNLGVIKPVLDYLADSPFMVKWVRARLEPDPGARCPSLTVVVYRERVGLLAPRRGEKGYTREYRNANDRISLPYLLALGSNGTNFLGPELRKVAANSRAAMYNLLHEIVASYYAADSGLTQGNELQQRVQQLAQEVAVFYSLPLLGQSIALELAAAQGNEERATTMAPEQLAKVLDDTNMHELLGTLAQPQMEAILASVAQAVEACNITLAEVHDERWAVRELSVVREEIEQSNFHRKKKESTLKILEQQVGGGSGFELQVFNRFTHLWNGMLVPKLNEFIQGTIRTSMEKAALIVADRMIKKFKLDGSARPRTGALQDAVCPSNLWLASEAPLKTWLQVEFMKHVKFDGMRDLLLEQALPEVQRISEELMVDVIAEYTPTHLKKKTEEERSTMRKFFADKLEEDFRFSKQVERALMTEFFKGRRSKPVAEYTRVLEDVLGSRLVRDLRNSLSKTVRMAVAKTTPANAGAVLSGVLTRWFQNHFTDTLLNHKDFGLKSKLVDDYMNDKFVELRFRLYDNGLTANTRDKRKRHMRWGTLFLKTYKQWHCVLLQKDLTIYNVRALEQAETHLTNFKNRLMQLAEPRELAKLLPPRMGRLLGRALVVAKTRIVQTATAPSVVMGPLAMLANAAQAVAIADELEDTAAHPAAASTSGSAAACWGNCADGSGVTVTAAQMAAFETHLWQLGLHLKDCPGVGNNCGYYAVLHQALGISLSASDPEAVETVKEYRSVVADILEHYTAAEAAQPAGLRVWTDAILALVQPAGAGELSAAAANEAVRLHLDGVREDAPMTNIELGVLSRLLEDANVLITLYNPTYEARTDYCSVQGDTAAATATHVRVANVPVGGAGELNHWNVVQPRGLVPTAALSTPAKKLPRDGGDEESQPSKQLRPNV